MGKTVKAALLQAAPVGFDVAQTLDKLEDLLADAAREGADIAVFPEAFVGGYPKGLDFGLRLGMRSDAGRDDFLRYYESAVDLPGPSLDRLCKMAKTHKVNLVGGVIERDGGTLQCTAVMIGRDGRYLGKHRKLVPTALERVVWGHGDGSTMPVVDMDVGKAGAVICWENRMPLLRTHMYAKGVELYCAPTVDDRDTWLPSMRHIAFEGRCFVLSCAQFTTRGDFPADYDCVQGNDPSTVLINGGSCIVSPMGEVLAEPVFGREAIVTAELDMDDIIRGKYDLDVTGHYARPDVFRLIVNEKPQPATEWED